MTDRDLRDEVILAFINHGGPQTPQKLARAIDDEVTPGAVRGVLLNLVRDNVVRKSEGYGGPTWELIENEVRDRLASSLQEEVDK